MAFCIDGFTFSFGGGGGGGGRPRPFILQDQSGPGLSAVTPLPFPLPTPSSPPATPPPGGIPGFGGPAANDPIFRNPPGGTRVRVGAGPIAAIGALIIGAAEIIVRQIEGVQFETMSDILRDQDRLLREIWRQRAEDRLRREFELEVEKKARSLESAPETFDPTPVEPTPAPLPRTTIPRVGDIVFPDFPLPLPGVLRPSVPLPQGVPTPSQPLPRRVPAPGTAPLPGRFGVPAPFAFPGTNPLPFSSPSPRPLTVSDPVGVPSPGPGTTSQFDPRFGTIILPFTSTQPQPETNPDRCQEVKRRRRRKNKCREGFFRESAGKTQFITWRESDCAPKRPKLKIVR